MAHGKHLGGLVLAPPGTFCPSIVGSATAMDPSSSSDTPFHSNLLPRPYVHLDHAQYLFSMDANTRIMMLNMRKRLLPLLPHHYHIADPSRPAQISGLIFGKMLHDARCFANISINIARSQALEDVKDSAKQAGQDLRVPVPPADVPGIGGVKSLTLKQLLCGSIAGAVASFVVSPFEVLRTRVIAGRGGRSAGQVLHKVVKFEGAESLMKGNFKVSLLATSMQKGVQFAVFEAVKRKEEETVGKDVKWVPSVSRKLPISTVAGAAAGFASTLVVYPFNTMMDRILLQPKEYTSIWVTVRKVIGKEGVKELYRGLGPAMVTMVAQAGVSFYTYEAVKGMANERWKKKYSEGWTAMGAGAAAGLVATTATYPLELARKKISLSGVHHSSSSFYYDNLGEALKGTLRREGFLGLYRGFIIHSLQFIPMTMVSFVVYESCKRIFIAQGSEHPHQAKG